MIDSTTRMPHDGGGGRIRFLGFLVLCSILWLLFLTCLRENWGFWQSPSVYPMLPHEYPQWLRAYVKNFYHPFLAFTAVQVVVWTVFQLSTLSKSGTTGPGRVSRAFLSVLFIWMLFGFTIGVMCANNLVNYVDRGELHGHSHINPWKR